MEYEISTLSFALAGICNILYPQAIIIGDTRGILTNDNIASMQQQINRQTLSKNYRQIDVCRSYRDGNLEVASCAISIVQKVFSGNLLFNND
jgi:hypothetical protein